MMLFKMIFFQAYHLSLIFGFQNSNKGNIITNKQKQLPINGFYVLNTDLFCRQNIFIDFKDKNLFGVLKTCNEILTAVPLNQRVNIAKDSLFRCKKIEKVSSKATSGEKSALRKHGIKFGTVTNDADEYIKNIKKNYALLCCSILQ